MHGNPEARARIEAVILGGAVGDACGAACEIAGFRGFDALPTRLRISDDTQLTLATCEAIAERGGVDPDAIAASFLRWFRARRLTGLGASTLKALRDLDAGGHWALAGARGERAAGNGAAMRAAPLAFVLDPEDANDRRTLRDVCRITHHHDEAYAGALAVVVALHSASTSSLDGLLERAAAALPDCRVRDRLRELAMLAPNSSIEDVGARYGNSGYVVESVPLALFIARDAATIGFSGVLERALRAGGDVDTIASIACQVATAAQGSSIERDLLDRIEGVHAIVAMARSFAAFVARSPR
ncbi:MAG: ADP-ribosylglycohydrolase family protein [Planctomycetes bacterium]|nr:ADP-ribosylglycohydrolase family protein [Planctomycetota bacterium]